MRKTFLLLAIIACSHAYGEPLDCRESTTTLELNQCAMQKLDTAEDEMRRYLEKSLDRHGDDKKLTEAIENAQKAWRSYRGAHCNSIYTMWRQGTIRDVMSLECQTRLTKQRTHELWLEFLTYMDSTDPVLPEPKK